MRRKITILGVRGVPANHGGFETFAENLAKYLAGNGWAVTVYCQETGFGWFDRSRWCGIERIHIPVGKMGALSTVIFDFLSVIHSVRSHGVFLTLGYNTAVFNVLYRIWGRVNLINMDGIEWQRDKWGFLARLWFWINERAACYIAHQLIADNPGIEDHLATRVRRGKIAMIPYGARFVESADVEIVEELGLVDSAYAIVVARPEPENSILEIVRAFSVKPRGIKLVVLGSFDVNSNEYHKLVVEAASDEVLFLGAIYDEKKVDSLRYFATFYIHGHRVGGTNPSLVEALGCGSAVVSYNNIFNRWVAKDAAVYFDSENDLSVTLDALLSDRTRLSELKIAARKNFQQNFEWHCVLAEYEALLEAHS